MRTFFDPVPVNVKQNRRVALGLIAILLTIKNYYYVQDF